jgi:hypothetical protein
MALIARLNRLGPGDNPAAHIRPVARIWCPHDHCGAVVASSQETGYHAPSRWPASDFKHGKQLVFFILEGFKWR